MTQKAPKALVLAGTNSGVGKTTLSIGLLAALRRRGIIVQPFKIGPDFLDPLHHEAACGRTCINLDGWMLDQQQVLDTFHRNMADADVALLEGVMGLYDGRDGQSDAGSTAQIAKWLNAPVVLVVDCSAIARSAAALVKGFREFDAHVRLAAVVLNKVGSDAHTAWLRDAIVPTNPDLVMLGGVPKAGQMHMPERHLGLHMPHDMQHDYVSQLADIIEAHVDLDALLQIASTADVPPCVDADGLEPIPRPLSSASHVRIAVASGPAFCFYYQENLTLLRHFGADIVQFDPLVDEHLPDGVAGVYLGGGYPELHAEALAANLGIRLALRAFAAEGGVVYAECGGLMYLSRSLQVDVPHGAVHEMVGVFPFRTVMDPDKMHMGYVEVTTLPGCPLFPPNTTARGQVFHFSEILQEQVVGGGRTSTDSDGQQQQEQRGWTAGYLATPQIPGANPIEEGYSWRNVLASYVHLHFGSCPAFAESLVQHCRRVDLLRVHQAASLATRAATLQLRTSPLCGGGASSSSLGSTAMLPGGLLGQHSPHQHGGPPGGAQCSQCGAHEVQETDTQSESMRSSSGGESELAGGGHVRSRSGRLSDGGTVGERSPLGAPPLVGVAAAAAPLPRLPPPPPMLALAPPPVAPGNPQPLYASGNISHVSSWQGSLYGGALGGAGGSSMSLAVDHAADVLAAVDGGTGQRMGEPWSTVHPYPPGVLYGGKDHHNSTMGGGGGAPLPTGTMPPPPPPTIPHTGHQVTTDAASRAAALAVYRHRDDILVSFSPAATEIAFALGLGMRVAAVTDLCDAPREAQSRMKSSRAVMGSGVGGVDDMDAHVKALKRQGVSPFVVDHDLLFSLQPSVVLAADHPKACGPESCVVAQALTDSGVIPSTTQLLTIAPHTLADVLTCIQEVGAVAGVPAEADALVRRLRQQLRCVCVLTASVAVRPRVMVLTSLAPLTAGGCWIPELIHMAGGVDCIQHPGATPLRLTWDTIRTAAPEVLILAPCSVQGGPNEPGLRGLADVSELAALPGWWALTAVKHGNVFFVDHALLGRPGPRLVEGVEALARMIHPSVVTKRCPDKAVCKLALTGGQRCRQRLLPNYFLPYQ